MGFPKRVRAIKYSQNLSEHVLSSRINMKSILVPHTIRPYLMHAKKRQMECIHLVGTLANFYLLIANFSVLIPNIRAGKNIKGPIELLLTFLSVSLSSPHNQRFHPIAQSIFSKCLLLSRSEDHQWTVFWTVQTLDSLAPTTANITNEKQPLYNLNGYVYNLFNLLLFANRSAVLNLVLNHRTTW